MRIGQFEVTFKDNSTLKINCASMVHAVEIANVLKPYPEMISIVKVH